VLIPLALQRLLDLRGKPVASLAILADSDPQWRPGPYQTHLWNCRVHFEYLTCKLLDFAEEDLIQSKSLSGNAEGSCGQGFWWWPRRRGGRSPAVGCNHRANAGHRQKTRRPEGFRGNGPLTSLLVGHRPCGYAPSSRLAIRPFPRKQDPSEFSDRLVVPG
jgi:hypothetical protein